MSTEILVAIIGAFATVVAAAIGVASGRRSKRQSETAETPRSSSLGLRLDGSPGERHRKVNDRSTVQVSDIFAGARDITLSGVTLLNVLQDREHLFQSLLTQSARLRVLLLNPASAAWAVWDNATDGAPNAAHLEAALGVLRKLRKRLPQAALEVRYAPYLLPTCLVLVDPELPSGRLIAELVFPDTMPFERPHLTLSRLEDPHWFDFFRDRLEILWKQSQDADLVGSDTAAERARTKT